ncbi:hypothetical protein GCM10010407_19950 [Rarobacter incanus]
MIFAEPLITRDSDEGEYNRLVPGANSGSIKYVTPGNIEDLDSIGDADVLDFGSGTYDMGAKHRALLNKRVSWVYLAPAPTSRSCGSPPPGEPSSSWSSMA